jgi:hypothetical protein
MTIVVESTYKGTLRRELGTLGITRESLFPDLEGLSAELNHTNSGGVRTLRSSGIPLEWLSPARREEAQRLASAAFAKRTQQAGQDRES